MKMILCCISVVLLLAVVTASAEELDLRALVDEVNHGRQGRRRQPSKERKAVACVQHLKDLEAQRSVVGTMEECMDMCLLGLADKPDTQVCLLDSDKPAATRSVDSSPREKRFLDYLMKWLG